MVVKLWNKIIVVALLLSVTACEKEVIDDPTQGLVQKALTVNRDAEIISNPYEINHMKNVLNQTKQMSLQYNKDNDYNAGLNINDFNIEPNYKYIKFNPANEKQEALLRADETLPLVDYPLSYQSADHYYIATNTEPPTESELPSYYTSVALNKQLPAVPYEELQLMYLPDEDIYFQGLKDEETPTTEGKISNKFDLINHIYTLAFQQSENGNLLPPDVIELDENNIQAKFLGISFRGKWTPSGHIEIWDENVTRNTTSTTRVIIGYETIPCSGNTGFNEAISYELEDGTPTGSGNSEPSGYELEIKPDNSRVCRRPIYETRTINRTSNYIPLVGAQVLVRDTFTLGNAITNSNGDFTHSRKRPAVRYVLQWERYHYSIRDGIWQAETGGPKMRERAWFKQIRGGEEAYHANIHRGAFMYYYENLPGLRFPATSLELQSQMKLAAVEESGSSSHVPFRRFVFSSVIKIKRWNEPTSDIVGTTIHELAHSVHWAIDRTSYNNIVWDAYIDPTLSGGLGPTANNNRRLLESWAMHIELLYTSEFYNRLGSTEPDYLGLLQNRTINENIHYTTGIFDLTDNVNQRFIPTANFQLPDDPAEGYSPLQLQQALIGARSWNQYRNNIKSLNIDNPADVDTLFANW